MSNRSEELVAIFLANEGGKMSCRKPTVWHGIELDNCTSSTYCSLSKYFLSA